MQEPSEDAKRLYGWLIRDELPRLSKPEQPDIILKHVREAQLDSIAKRMGFHEWVSAQRPKAVSRPKMMSRLMQEREFRAVLMQTKGRGAGE